jgi:hypothetical protein
MFISIEVASKPPGGQSRAASALKAGTRQGLSRPGECVFQADSILRGAYAKIWYFIQPFGKAVIEFTLKRPIWQVKREKADISTPQNTLSCGTVRSFALRIAWLDTLAMLSRTRPPMLYAA